MRDFKNLTFPLRATLVTAVIVSAALAIALSIGFMGVPMYLKAKKSVLGLWEDLAKQVALTATGQILDYFQDAPIALATIQGFIEGGELKSQELNVNFNICHRAILQNPQFVTVSYSQTNGTFTGVFKMGNDFLGSHRIIQPDGTTLIESYRIGSDGSWTLFHQEIGAYDPRTRPFWQVGIAHPEGAWTEPYQFITTKAKGYSYVLGQKINREIAGFWSVDFQIDNLSQYLQSLSVGKEGTVFIVSDDGLKIAETKPNTASKKMMSGSDFNKDALRTLIHSNAESRLINTNQLIIYVKRFPKESLIPWNIITIIHEGDFLHPMRDASLHAIGYGLLPCLLFLLGTAVLFGNMSSRLKEIASEMSEAGDLSFQFAKDKPPFSRIREINMMNRSLQKMKVGLHSFSKYVPLDLIKKLVHSGLSPKLGGEKKQISVFFADLAQFTTLSEKLNSDEIAKILGEFLDIATREVHKEKGIIDKFMGDAAMDLFGAPDPISHHALAACDTALAMKEVAKKSPLMKYKIGINSGLALVGNFGSQVRMDYTAIGDTVNIAARLEKLNKLYNTQILIGPETADAVRGILLVRPIDWVVLQGKTQAMLIYELIDKKENSTAPLNQAISFFSAGLESYRNQRFFEAITQFNQASLLFGGNDTPCKILIERCRLFEINPPPPNWNGTAIPD